MACLSGNSTGTTITTTTIKNSSSDEDLQQVMNDRKRKRMESNRESARRSRMRKQKHLDDLTAQVDILRRDNSRILTAVQMTTQQLLNVEAENSVLTAQITELATRLDSLTQILTFMNSCSGGGNGGGGSAGGAAAGVVTVDVGMGFDSGSVGNHWCVNQNQNQPVMVSDFQVFGY